MTSDTLGGKAKLQQTQIIVCVGPSKFDYQDTLNSNYFGADTGKVRHKVGDIRELEGLRGEHVLFLDDAKKFAIKRSKPMIAMY